MAFQNCIGVFIVNPDASLGCYIFPTKIPAQKFLNGDRSYFCSRVEPHLIDQHLEVCEECQNPAYHDMLYYVGYYETSIDEIIQTSFIPTQLTHHRRGFEPSLSSNGWCDSGSDELNIELDGKILTISTPQEFMDAMGIDYFAEEDGIFIPNFKMM